MAENRLHLAYEIYKTYEWLLNSNVLDYFTHNHWSKLPSNWQSTFHDLNNEELVNLLDCYNQTINKKVWPLSILAIKAIVRKTSICRDVVDLEIEDPDFIKNKKFLKLFWKNVKEKKRHEISILSKLCYKKAQETNCFHIVDIGSGLGHLSRILNYGYNLEVCTIEAEAELSKQAVKLDEEIGKLLKSTNKKTKHINTKIEPEIGAKQFISIVNEAFNYPPPYNIEFGIVGLHPCGDLGATLLKLFNACDNIKFINIVGCCYMKLTKNNGFPLSKFCTNLHYDLDYHSREIACHAIENYIEKIQAGECWRLKIHTYRALIERILIKIDRQLGHTSLNSVKYTQGLTFKDYCTKSTAKLDIHFDLSQSEGNEIDSALSQWKKVVVFYSLRLLFAPVIETIILLDRFLSIEEKGGDCAIIAVFNPQISPRNQVVTAKK